MTSDMWIIFFCGITLGALIESIIAAIINYMEVKNE